MVATRRAWARTRPISRAFCSPVEAIPAGMSFGPWRTRRSEACGPTRVRPAARSRARSRAGSRGSGPPRRPPAGVATRASISPSIAIAANGNGDASSRVARIRLARRCTVSRRAAETAIAEFRHLALQGVEPERVVGALLEHPVARAQRPLERVDPCAVLRIDREHQPVEEAAPVAGRAAEQRVEVGRQPDDAQVLGEGGRRGDRRAVDPAQARRAAVGARRLDAGAEAVLAVAVCRGRSTPRRSPARPRGPCRPVPPGAAAARHEQRDGFEHVGLAGPVLADERHERRRREVERRVGAEILEDQAGDAGAPASAPDEPFEDKLAPTGVSGASRCRRRQARRDKAGVIVGSDPTRSLHPHRHQHVERRRPRGPGSRSASRDRRA